MISFQRAALLVMALLVSACTSLQYIPPASDAGKQCVTTCDTNRQICISGQQQLAAGQNQSCEIRRATQLATCLSMAGTPQARAYCEKTVPRCAGAFANTGNCETQYRSCYVQCGGQVIEVQN